MNYLSLFSGIEAATIAWKSLGWKCVGLSEIERFPCAVLNHYYPDTPNLGDVTKITEEQIKALGQIDLIVGGFPCQDLSIAGKRAGLRREDGTQTRSGLFFDAWRIAGWAKKHCGLRWLVLENVPGLYSSNRGKDFQTLVAELTGGTFDVPKGGWQNTGAAVGPNGLIEWSTLDAQWFGVAQRRRRCFIVADFGNWPDRQPLLFDKNSLSGNLAPKRKTQTDVTEGTGDGTVGSLCARDSKTVGDQVFPVTWPADVASTLDTHYGDKQGLENQHVNGGCALFVASTLNCLSGIQSPDTMNYIVQEPSFTLSARDGKGVNGNANPGNLLINNGVRRLTPLEFERLQGFPDYFTRIPIRHYSTRRISKTRPADYWERDPNGGWWLMSADGPRYKALGNSFAIPPVRWVGQQIDNICKMDD